MSIVKNAINYMKNSFKNTYLVLIIILLFALSIRLFFFSGMGISDSLEYSEYAYELSKRNFPEEYDHGVTRSGFIIPVSFFYSVLGVNDFSSVLFPLLVSLSGIVLIFFFGKFLFNEKIGLIAAFLLAFFPLDVVNSTRPITELPSAFFASLSVFLFLVAEKTAIKFRRLLLYLASGISVGVAFTIREMTILILLFYLAYVLYRKRFRIGYFAVGAGFLAMIILEMVFFYKYTGNMFFKFDLITGSDLLNTLGSTGYYGRAEFPKFFFTWPYVIFGNVQLGFFYLFISLACVYWILNRKQETDYLLMWFIVILLYLYLGTQSLSTYAPIQAVARYLTLVTFPGILLLAAFLAEKEVLLRRLLLPFSLIFLLITSIGAIHLDLINHLYGIEKVYGVKIVKDNYKNNVYPFIKTIDKPIYTDPRSIDIIKYTSGFSKTLNLFDLYASQVDINNLKDAYILVNNKKGFRNDIEFIPPNWTTVVEIGEKPEEKIIVYYAK